jgi:type IV pilus assembly protein PilV
MALMEALIALLLLSFAALAYAALQMRGLSASHSALWRSKAGLLAYDMADRLRANRAGVVAGSYNSLISPPTAPACGSASACSPASMAVLDFALWRDALGNELPAGAGVVCLDSTPDDGTAAAPACDGSGTMFAAKVFWREKGEDSRVSVAVRP